MATNGQFYWPSAGNSVAAHGQFDMAANRRDDSSHRCTCAKNRSREVPPNSDVTRLTWLLLAWTAMTRLLGSAELGDAPGS
jgi:hypothetical protein